MEDHKKKSKKRNQNKRPTAEQIKKLQNSIEQNKDKVNGVQEESSQNLSSVKSFENSHDVDLKVENLSEANGNNKKNKKKNKQKTKQHIESVIPSTSMNGLLEDGDSIDDHSKYNGVDTKDKTNSQSKNPVSPQTNNNGSQEHERPTSNCYQYHGNDAPTCSHHIQHHISNINMGDFKIDIDVQKELSEITSSLDSHEENFEARRENNVNNSHLNSMKDNVADKSQFIQENIGNAKLDENSLSFENMFANIGMGFKLNEPQGHVPLPFDPNIMMKSMFAKKDSLDETAFNPNELLKNMFGSNQSQAFNPQDILKSMIVGESEQDHSPIKPFEMMNKMFEGSKNEGNKPANPNEFLQNMFGGILSNTGTSGNPAKEIKKNIMGKEEENHNDLEHPRDIQIPDMFSQMNEMARHIDPNLMSSMTQMVASMDPSILMGVNNMVAGMMQNGGFQETIQNLKQMKNNSVKEREAKVVECSNNQFLDSGIELSNSVEEKTSNIIIKSSDDVLECMKHEEKIPKENIFSQENNDSSEKTDDPLVKDSVSEPSEEDKKEVEQTIHSDSEKEDKKNQQKIKRFVREESIPELLDTLIKKDTNKEIKIEKIEIKTNKFKTILNKVLRKEKKCVEGSTSKVEVSEERIEYQRFKKPNITNANESKSNIVMEIDYDKLQHVKEPLETQEKKNKTLKTKNQRTSDQFQEVENEKDENKSDGTGEFNKDDINLLESKENLVPDDYIEFNPESVNELFTNLLQGKKMLNKKRQPDNTVANSDSENKNPVGGFLKDYTSLLESPGLNQKQGENMNPTSGLVDSGSTKMIPLSMMMQNMSNDFGALFNQNNVHDKQSGGSELQADELGSFKNIMSQMLNNFSPVSSDADKNSHVLSSLTGNNDDLLQNLQQVLMQQFSSKSKEDENQSNGNLFENMGEMFEKVLSNKGESTFPNIQNIFENEENMKGILQMGEMLFGKSPFDTIEVRKEECKILEHKSCESEEKMSTSDQDINNDDEKVTVVHFSKNVYQHERPSVLLKELLGEEFWSIRKKRTDLIKDVNTKSKFEEKNKRKNVSTKIETQSEIISSKPSSIKVSSEPEIMPFDLEKELEKESPLVRMLHKKIQKDTKLQQFLKEKLQKDPKMQKFIQERLQKDERVQKFMREKLAKDKNLRKTFENKLKNDLGLTNFLPKFDDDDSEDEKETSTNQGERDSQKPNNLFDKQFVSEERKENLKSSVETSSKKNTGLLLKKYAELTMCLVGIIYMGILCY